MTDFETIAISTAPYIVLKSGDDSDWNLSVNCTHFKIRDRQKMSVWCDHGDWHGVLQFDSKEALTGIFVVYTQTGCPVTDYRLTHLTVFDMENGKQP